VDSHTEDYGTDDESPIPLVLIVDDAVPMKIYVPSIFDLDRTIGHTLSFWFLSISNSPGVCPGGIGFYNRSKILGVSTNW
tara:strand:+ start:74 stop:313 length:240 start_codon:yes stop_codon:yes gene_type:complete